MSFDLERFVQAQDAGGSYDTALAELRGGRKRTHWVWYVLPQLRGLGRSEMADRYGISGVEEAAAYLAHPVLGPRLHACTEALLSVPVDDPVAVMGPDAVKLHSSMTLFAQVSAAFVPVLDKYFHGDQDAATLRLLRD